MGEMTIIAQEYIPGYQDLTVGYDSLSTNYACGNKSEVVVWFEDKYTFETTPVIWLNSDGTGVPDDGWYAYGGKVRLWSGAGFTVIFDCPIANPIDLIPTSSLVGACNGTLTEFWLQNNETFDTMTAIYEDEYVADYAPAGWYSNGTNARYWNGSNIMGDITACITSTGIVLGDGADASTACEDLTPTEYFINDIYDFETTPMIYTDSDLTQEVGVGFYSDGVYSREKRVVAEIGGVLDDQVICAPTVFYYDAIQYLCFPDCTTSGPTGYRLQSDVELVQSKYYFANGSVWFCGSPTVAGSQTILIVDPTGYDSCELTPCGDTNSLDMTLEPHDTSALACAAGGTHVEVYLDHAGSPIVGDIVYTTSPPVSGQVWNGNNKWFNDDNVNEIAYQISSTGEILNIVDCTI